MSYRVVILRAAQKRFDSLPTLMRSRIQSAILALGETPRPPGCVKMTDRNSWRIRVGEYRVIYTINDREVVVTVIEIGHRRDVYR